MEKKNQDKETSLSSDQWKYFTEWKRAQYSALILSIQGKLTININGHLHQFLVDMHATLSTLRLANFDQPLPWELLTHYLCEHISHVSNGIEKAARNISLILEGVINGNTLALICK